MQPCKGSEAEACRGKQAGLVGAAGFEPATPSPPVWSVAAPLVADSRQTCDLSTLLVSHTAIITRHFALEWLLIGC